jgi:hypothetical protein
MYVCGFGTGGFGTPAELEFAVNKLAGNWSKPFIRPLFHSVTRDACEWSGP